MKILNQRLQITDKSINSSIRQFIIENTKTFQKHNNIHIDVDRMMKEHYQAYNSVKDKNYIIYIGFLNVKFEEDVNIIDIINTHRCENMVLNKVELKALSGKLYKALTESKIKLDDNIFNTTLYILKINLICFSFLFPFVCAFLFIEQ
eukprot:421556_1